ncbi:hypothetical protein Glove_330g48 [Diversispora epigaea]|uniref:Uncharacterized protein n=1 Tax=Diversispora epigaea TaxID=1348612 RepID=A0A397HMR1_9GLOM|nr:hypothetical protein Glove_330g48 [Diversispora epigaea]
MANTQSEIDSLEELSSRLKTKLDKPKEILNEEPIIEYRPFLNGLELDAFFQKYQITLEVQGVQHRLHIKKLENIVNRD